jgi:rhamnose utilization protein RhaD (predicted bifunctional aldolase and dehydrogenase)
LRGAFIPSYIKPGAPLAAAVTAALADHGPVDVLLLQNHGAVVGADRPAAAAALLREVERRLAFPVRVLPSADVAAARAHESEDYCVSEGHCRAALDPFLFDALTRAPLTPDQVVFLGGAVCVAEAGFSVSAAARAAEAAIGAMPALVYKAGIGAFRRRDCTPGALSMIDALLDVALRIPERAEVIGLSRAAAAELLAWDAEKYRKSLDTARA